MGNCSLLKLKHRFSSNAQANLHQQQQQQQMELRCSRATGSSECSVQQPVGINNLVQTNNIQPQTDKSTTAKIVDQPSAQQAPTKTLQCSLANNASVTRTEVVQLPSNLNTNEEIKKQPEHREEHNLNETQPPNASTSSDSLKNKSSISAGSREQQEKMMMVSITNGSKDAVIV